MKIFLWYTIVEIIFGIVVGVFFRELDSNTDTNTYIDSMPPVKKTILYICCFQLIVAIVPFIIPMFITYDYFRIKERTKNDKD